jgi:hypothetical protein
MKYYQVTALKPEPEEWIHRQASLSHVKNLIEPDTIILAPNGEVIIVFGKLEQEFSDVKTFLRKVKYNKNRRATRYIAEGKNAKNFSDATFGYKPKKPIFNTPASACNFNFTYPAYYSRLIQLGLHLTEKYKTYGAAKYEYQKNTVTEQVKPNWIIPGTVFTQGIINDSNTLDYHYDRGNFKDFWSCMSVFCHDIKGGELVVPSLDLALNIQDYTYVLFNGQAHIHGVNTIKKLSAKAFRYSVVYYALQGMKNCESLEAEIQKARNADLVKHLKKVKTSV